MSTRFSFSILKLLDINFASDYEIKMYAVIKKSESLKIITIQNSKNVFNVVALHDIKLYKTNKYLGVLKRYKMSFYIKNNWLVDDNINLID